MKVLGKLTCKDCGDSNDLHRLEHPAGWQFTLCGKCTEMVNEENKSHSVNLNKKEHAKLDK